jgi:L-iditol 2-dehydrogenase
LFMKALVYTGPQTLDWRDEPDPLPSKNELIVRVEACGICGSDMHAYHGHDGRRPPPLILGHEISGRVVTGKLTGSRVAINPLIHCGECEECRRDAQHLCLSRQILSMSPRQGGFAQLVRVPDSSVVPVPDDFPPEVAALSEPLAVSYHAVVHGLQLLRRPAPALRALVFGSGAIGFAAALSLRLFGAADVCICEANVLRCESARAAGFDCYVPGAAGEPRESSIDLVIDAVGAESTRIAATRFIKPGGVIVHVGLLPGSSGFDVRRITLQEIIVTGSYCYRPRDFRDVVALLIAGRFGKVDWIEKRRLEDGAAAFQDIDQNKIAAPKVVLLA